MDFLNRLSIRAKVVLAFGIVFLVTTALGAFAVQRLSAVNDVAKDIRDDALVGTRELGNISGNAQRYRQLLAAFTMSKTPAEMDQEEKTMQTVAALVESAFKAYTPSVGTAEEHQLADQLTRGWANFQVQARDYMQKVRQDKNFDAAASYKGEMRTGFNAFADVLQKDIDYNVASGNTSAKEGEEIYASGRNWIAAAILGAMALCVAAAVMIVVNVSRPISAMTESMRRLAARDMATEIAGVGRRDEIGTMAGAVQVFKDNMIEADRLAKAQEAERAHKEKRGAALESLTRDFEAKTGKMVEALSSAATEMQATSQSMSSMANDTNERSVAVAAAAEEASTNVQTVASATEELSSSVSEISRQVAQSAKVAGKAVEDAKRTDKTVQALAEGAQKIGDVVKLISDIASQTNLLALNATIEAARAGEMGKGFAVVASEVKSLANQTAKATEDISGQIAAMQGATNDAVEAIRGISTVIDEINGIAAAIAAAVEQQGSATQEIARNVQQAAAGTQEVTRNIASVKESSSASGAAANEVLTAASGLSQQAEGLTAAVGSFIAQVKAA